MIVLSINTIKKKSIRLMTYAIYSIKILSASDSLKQKSTMPNANPDSDGHKRPSKGCLGTQFKESKTACVAVSISTMIRPTMAPSYYISNSERVDC